MEFLKVSKCKRLTHNYLCVGFFQFRKIGLKIGISKREKNYIGCLGLDFIGNT